MRYELDGHALLIAHNFGHKPCVASLPASAVKANQLTSLLSTEVSTADASGKHLIELEPYGYRWLRIGEFDRNPNAPED
jgi:maltose alpha-D-glucosyltransferase / alpha-amylase